MLLFLMRTARWCHHTAQVQVPGSAPNVDVITISTHLLPTPPIKRLLCDGGLLRYNYCTVFVPNEEVLYIPELCMWYIILHCVAVGLSFCPEDRNYQWLDGRYDGEKALYGTQRSSCAIVQ
jgi:hypothetical protein